MNRKDVEAAMQYHWDKMAVADNRRSLTWHGSRVRTLINRHWGYTHADTPSMHLLNRAVWTEAATRIDSASQGGAA